MTFQGNHGNTGIIYKLIDNTNGDIYIGATGGSLEKILCHHRTECKRYMSGKLKTLYATTSIINNGDYKIEPLHKFNYHNNQEMLKEKQIWLNNWNDTKPLINRNKAYQTEEEKKAANSRIRGQRKKNKNKESK